jgi:hypothetical protein
LAVVAGVLVVISASLKPWWLKALAAGVIVSVASLVASLVVKLAGIFIAYPNGFGVFMVTGLVLLIPSAVALVIGATKGVAEPVRPTTSGQEELVMIMDDGTIAEGWYMDPNGNPAERFWDGSDWTDKTRPVTAGAIARQAAVAAGKLAVDPEGKPVSPCSRLVALLLVFFLGILGIHRFYVGKVGTGVLMVFTLGGLGIWVLVDFILILAGAFRDKQGRRLLNW